MKFNRRSTVSAATQTSLGERNKHRCTNPVRGLAAAQALKPMKSFDSEQTIESAK